MFKKNCTDDLPFSPGMPQWGTLSIATLLLLVATVVPSLGGCYLLRRPPSEGMARRLPITDQELAERWLEIESARHRDELDLIREEMQGLLAYNPKDPAAHVLVARTMEDLNDAYPFYLSALELDGQYYWARVGMGIVYLDLGLTSRAIMTLEPVVRLYSKRTPGILALARAQWESGNLDEAGQLLERAHTLEPENATIRRELGFLVLEMGDELGAIRHLSAAAPFYAGDWNLYLQVASLNEREGENQVALEFYKGAGEINPQSIDAQMGVARLGLATGESEVVMPALEKVLEMQPWNRTARKLKAQKVYEQGDCRTALKYMDELLEDEPDNRELRVHRAECVHREEDREKALLSWLDVLERFPDAVEARGAIEEIVTAAGASMTPTSAQTHQRLFDLHLQSILACYQRVMEEAEEGEKPASGRILTRVTIDDSGKPSDVQIVEDPIDHPHVRICTFWQLWNAQYPPTGQAIMVDFPVPLQ